MALIKDIIELLESRFPLALQEEYDNCGLLVGDKNQIVKGILLSLDINEAVIDEAISGGFNFIITHHPLVFNPIKKLSKPNRINNCLSKAIKSDIAIYSAHTNLDNSIDGLNKYLANLLGVHNIKPLVPQENLFLKLITFVPENYAHAVRQAIFDAGAGHIGNYDSCSFNIGGQGTFRANEKANPFVGQKGQIHFENEIRIETILPVFIADKVIKAMIEAHPYEEVAYDLYPLTNKSNISGAGIVGELKNPIEETDFLDFVKKQLNVTYLRHSELLNKKIQKVAICSGNGSSFLNDAVSHNADVYISAEFKYSQFVEAQKHILLIDAGHFETEIFSLDIFLDLISKNFNTFATAKTKKFENPVKYF